MEPIEEQERELLVPDYARACISNVVPALLESPLIGRGWIPDRALDAEQVVVLLVDGLGWNQLAQRTDLAPLLASSPGRAITTVAPTTTAAALTSLATGCTPGEHGLVGYRLDVDGEVLNVLRWTTESGDARLRIVPDDIQQIAPFGNRGPVVITRAEFEHSGFTRAHLGGTRFRGYSAVSTLIHEIVSATERGERFVYAYYDGLDRVGHERGHGAEFDEEYRFVDWLVGAIRRRLPERIALLVTGDHGQVDSSDAVVELDAVMLRSCRAVSGEARFVWLHAEAGCADRVHRAATEAHSHHAWVLTRDEVLACGLLGPRVSDPARQRCGDVALIAQQNIALAAPGGPPSSLRGRHGSLTAAELYVPLLCPA